MMKGQLKGDWIEQDSPPPQSIKCPLYQDWDHRNPGTNGQDKKGSLKVLDLPVYGARPLGKNNDRDSFLKEVRCLPQAYQPFPRIGSIHWNLA